MRFINNKYGSRKVEVDGIVFDSKREAKRYQELKLLEKAGKIKDLQMQVKFTLIPAQFEMNGTKKGKCIERECAYIADFVYKEPVLGSMDDFGITLLDTVVEDTKGFRTKDYIIKRKLMLHVFGIRIREV